MKDRFNGYSISNFNHRHIDADISVKNFNLASKNDEPFKLNEPSAEGGILYGGNYERTML